MADSLAVPRTSPGCPGVFHLPRLEGCRRSRGLVSARRQQPSEAAAAAAAASTGLGRGRSLRGINKTFHPFGVNNGSRPTSRYRHQTPRKQLNWREVLLD